MPTSNDRPVLEAALENSEVVFDVLTTNDVLAEIPIVGTAFKLLRAADAIRDRALFAKLAEFARPFEGRSEDQKNRFKDKLKRDPAESKKIGEVLFLVLDRLTDIEKPGLLGYVFISYLDGMISDVELRRLSQAVDVAFGDDLKVLLSSEEAVPGKSKEQWMQYLAASGLTGPIGGNTFGDVGEIYHDITPLGHKLRKSYFHGRRDESG